jgi:hypothetical protein
MSIAEFDYSNVDPRTYLRYLKRDIQEVTTGGVYKYDTYEPEGQNPLVRAENVGAESGRVEGRLVAGTNWQKFAGSKTEEESSPIGAIVAGILGLLFLVIGAVSDSAQGALFGVGLLLLVIAAALYHYNEPTIKQSEYYYRKEVKILLEGEVAEYGESDGPADVIASDLSVTCSESFVFEYRDSEGSQYISRDEIPSGPEANLKAEHVPVTDEVDFNHGAVDVYCQRAL